MSGENGNPHWTFVAHPCWMENHHDLEAESYRISGLHQLDCLCQRCVQRRNTFHDDSALFSHSANLLTNSFSNETPTMGHAFSSGIAGTGPRGLFERPLLSIRDLQQDLLLQQSVVHTVNGNKMNSGFDNSPLSSTTDIHQLWTPMALALECLHEALEVIPTTEKLNYLAAFQVAPDLVLKNRTPFASCVVPILMHGPPLEN